MEQDGHWEWDVWVKPDGNLDAGPQSAMVSMLLVPMRDGAGNVTQINSGPLVLKRADAGADPAHFFDVTPSKPVSELRAESLHVAPPKEAGPFRKPDLVELTSLDQGFHLDIRYAQSNNFPEHAGIHAGPRLHAASRLRSAAACVEKAAAARLRTADSRRVSSLVCQQDFLGCHSACGSQLSWPIHRKARKHNRGCAVDLTLYDLATGQAIEMPGLYDEMSPRSFPTFPGGTSLQGWHRDLLRKSSSRRVSPWTGTNGGTLTTRTGSSTRF